MQHWGFWVVTGPSWPQLPPPEELDLLILYLGAMDPFKKHAELYDGPSCMFLKECIYLPIRISQESRTWKRSGSLY